MVGELSTGILLGPSVFGLLAPEAAARLLPAQPGQAHLLDAVAQFAVLMFVGVAGAHLDLGMVRRRRGVMLKVSLGSLLIPLGLGVGAGFLIPRALMGEGAQRPVFALYLGVALSVSAIPVIAKTLADMRLIHRDVGQLTLASAALTDAVSWFLLSLVSTMAVGALAPGDIALAVLSLAGFVAAAAFAGRPLVRWVMRRAGRTGDPVPVAAAARRRPAERRGEPGARTGGGVRCVRSRRPALPGGRRRLLAPLRSVTLAVFAPLFLATAGLRIDLTALADPTVLVTGLVVLVLASLGKLAGGYLGARSGGLGHWEGIAIGSGSTPAAPWRSWWPPWACGWGSSPRRRTRSCC